MEATQITKEEFEAYEEVRASGVTNMMMVRMVCELSGLERETVLAIMQNYNSLQEQFT